MSKKQFDNNLFLAELSGKASQAHFVSIVRKTNHQLVAKLFGELFLQVNRYLIVDFLAVFQDVERLSQFVLWQGLHSNQQPAAISRATCPFLDILVDLLPAAKIKEANTEVGSL